VDDRVAREVLEQGAFYVGVVMPVVQRARAREEVKILAAGLIPYVTAQGAVENRRPTPAVASDFGL
jgi:xanthine/CO dehydrogenase XdhC/CoxF family maturation factor